MKNLIMIIAAVTTLSFSVLAQDADSREKLIFGMKAGANYSNVFDSQGESFEADAKIGFVAGTFVSIPIGSLFGIQPEILFSQKGFRATGRILGSTYEFTRTTSYIDVPIFFALKPIENITFLAGPQYSYLINQKDVFKNESTSIAQETEFGNDNIRKNLMSFIGGFDFNMEHYALGFRVGWDFLNNNGDGTSATPRYKNVWYQATLGYRFY